MVENCHGLIITDWTVVPQACAGYLFMFEGKAFDPSGLINGVTTQEEVDAHNKVLSRMEIDGLDKHCKVGQGWTYYVKGSDERKAPTTVTTWIGEVIAPLRAERYRLTWKLTFVRRGKTMEAILKKGECCAHFTCIKIEGQDQKPAHDSVGASAGAAA